MIHMMSLPKQNCQCPNSKSVLSLTQLIIRLPLVSGEALLSITRRSRMIQIAFSDKILLQKKITMASPRWPLKPIHSMMSGKMMLLICLHSVLKLRSWTKRNKHDYNYKTSCVKNWKQMQKWWSRLLPKRIKWRNNARKKKAITMIIYGVIDK